MTQQPYGGYPAQPGYPPAPQQQQYPPQYPQAPAPPNQAYPPQQQQPYAQPYPSQPYPQQIQAPQQPLAQGGLDDFYAQPSAGSGPGISWTDKAGNQRPIGMTFIGIVARDVTNGDVQQQTSPQGAPAFFRDGRPKFQMKVPLKQVAMFDPHGQQLPTPDFPEGEATWYVRGQARDELTRAMAEAGCEGAPAGGAVVSITLVQRRPNGGGMQPSNIVQIRYQGPQGAAKSAEQSQVQPVPPGTGAPSPAPVPVQQAPVQQPYVQQVPQPPAQPAAGYQQPVPAVQQTPQAQQAPAPGIPQGMDAEQAALFARITGQQQPGAA